MKKLSSEERTPHLSIIETFRNLFARANIRINHRSESIDVDAFGRSVNEVICHGIPDQRKLREGDIVNLGGYADPSFRLIDELNNFQTSRCTMTVRMCESL